MTEPLVELRAVTRTFGNAIALEDVTLDIRRGDRIALMGRSGSGKSTLLNLIAGLDAPTRGTVKWPGLANAGPLRPACIGIMFQTRSLIPWLNVIENVQLPLELAGGKQDIAVAAISMLALLGVNGLADKLPEELSGGQAQRVALARAMVTTPALLLADEPTGQLDRDTAADLISRLTAWAKQHEVALLLATHDPLVADAMGRTWAIERGTIVEMDL